MHAPDGFLNAGTAVATGVISFGTISMAMRQAKQQLSEKAIPLAGLTAAFVFAAQMFNFPVAAGTTGHLLGGALAAILLGPHLGALVVSVVVMVQALIFADGGMTALGYNVLNMAIIPAYGGYAVFTLFRRFLPRTGGGVIAASGLASGLTVVMSAAAFSVEWLFGATAPVSFSTVFGAMVGVHTVIGIGEAVITAMTVGAVMASRPDLIHGAADLDHAEARANSVPLRTFLIGGVLATVVVASIVSQFAVDQPDGLESVASQTGIEEAATDHALAGSIFSDYAVTGIENDTAALAVAGTVGVVVTLAVAYGLLRAARPKRSART